MSACDAKTVSNTIHRVLKQKHDNDAKNTFIAFTVFQEQHFPTMTVSDIQKAASVDARLNVNATSVRLSDEDLALDSLETLLALHKSGVDLQRAKSTASISFSMPSFAELSTSQSQVFSQAQTANNFSTNRSGTTMFNLDAHTDVTATMGRGAAGNSFCSFGNVLNLSNTAPQSAFPELSAKEVDQLSGLDWESLSYQGSTSHSLNTSRSGRDESSRSGSSNRSAKKSSNGKPKGSGKYHGSTLTPPTVNDASSESVQTSSFHTANTSGSVPSATTPEKKPKCNYAKLSPCVSAKNSNFQQS